jgi:hypothetical protein
MAPGLIRVVVREVRTMVLEERDADATEDPGPGPVLVVLVARDRAPHLFRPVGHGVDAGEVGIGDGAHGVRAASPAVEELTAEVGHAECPAAHPSVRAEVGTHAEYHEWVFERPGSWLIGPSDRAHRAKRRSSHSWHDPGAHPASWSGHAAFSRDPDADLTDRHPVYRMPSVVRKGG